VAWGLLLAKCPVRHLLFMVLLTVACGPQTGTRLEPIEARTAVVGRELAVLVQAETDDPRVQFTFDSDLVDLATRRLKPTFASYAGGAALFRWTPLADDAGLHVVRFSATLDGTVANTVMSVTVVAGQDPIAFRQPVGDGTTLDLSRDTCVDVALLVEDSTVTEVALGAGEPWSDGGLIMQDGPLSGTLSFCPSAAQSQDGSIFTFTIQASDKQGQRAEKRYLVVLAGKP